MSTSPRRTRLQRKQLAQDLVADANLNQPDPHIKSMSQSTTTPSPSSTSKGPPIPLPSHLTKSTTALSQTDHALLLQKQSLLRTATLPSLPALSATLLFAQPEAGTATCLTPSGLLLTCSHCIAPDLPSFSPSQPHWLLLSTGFAVSALCIAFDPRRDLALLQITHSQTPGPFPFVSIADVAPKPGARLLCVGHPGSEDLETDMVGVKTGYDVLCVSEGRFRGCAEGQDVEDNEEIGALKHDCWTYWGHSGAGLVERGTGRLVGVHSSWGEESGMRRGVAWEAVKAFLGEWGVLEDCV